jgi:hypothetical protein
VFAFPLFRGCAGGVDGSFFPKVVNNKAHSTTTFNTQDTATTRDPDGEPGS